MTKPRYVIVVGIDYSSASEHALNTALSLACSKHGVQLHVVNVRSPLDPPTASNGAPAPLPPLEYWAAELSEYVARQIAAFQATPDGAAFQHVHTHQRMNEPAHELAQLAADIEADLVVVGTHDWHDVTRRTLGSVAEAVTRLAPCPVLVVRRKVASPPLHAVP
ncbi:MAG: universal stress protein [Pseudomonadota bacterium]